MGVVTDADAAQDKDGAKSSVTEECAVKAKVVCSSARGTGTSTMRSVIHSCGTAFTVSTVCSWVCGTRFRTMEEKDTLQCDITLNSNSVSTHMRDGHRVSSK